jgi:alpha-ketoglutarate-dependent 2,4-dichlorophenoxyacetate dioxygenase
VTLTFRQLHPHFAGEVSPIDLRRVNDPETLDAIRRGLDQYAVLVFHDQLFTNEEQLAFAQRFDGKIHTKSASAAIFGKNRLGYEGISDVSNVNDKNEIMKRDDRRRMSMMTNRLWHTDASFQDPPGRYSMLSGRVIPPEGGDTEFADMRAAYDALDEKTKKKLEGLRVFHSITYNKQVLGFEISQLEADKLKGAVHPLVVTLPRTGRRSLYLAAHTAHVVDWPVAEGRLLLRDLTEHATQREFVFRHTWRTHDFVIWDNRSTMHRGRPFDDTVQRRELVRTTTLDDELSAIEANAAPAAVG